METIDRNSCRLFLAAFIDKNKLSVNKVSKIIGCSESTSSRILAGKALPSDEFIRQTGLLIALGFKDYSSLQESRREDLSEKIGTLSGGTLGFSAITVAISSLGSISGLSAAGITTGLGAIGSAVGGGMLAGISIASTIPLAAGALGYAVIKGVKVLVENYKFKKEDFDPYWEMPLETEKPSNQEIPKASGSMQNLSGEEIPKLVQEVMQKMTKPYRGDIIDRVFLEIEKSAGWNDHYKKLIRIRGKHYVNPQIARWVFKFSGFNKSGPVKKATGKLIKTFKWLS
jgi:hypothetical protein